MNWSNVKLILRREVRDQLRDRRTLFMIAVLPLLLYPLLGMSFFQIAQFLQRACRRRCWCVGATSLPDVPPLVEGRPLRRANLFASRKRNAAGADASRRADAADRLRGRADAARRRLRRRPMRTMTRVIYFPPDFAEQLARIPPALADR